MQSTLKYYLKMIKTSIVFEKIASSLLFRSLDHGSTDRIVTTDTTWKHYGISSSCRWTWYELFMPRRTYFTLPRDDNNLIIVFSPHGQGGGLAFLRFGIVHRGWDRLHCESREVITGSSLRNERF